VQVLMLRRLPVVSKKRMNKVYKYLCMLPILGCIGCSQSPLRDVHYIADDWILAAYDQEHEVFVHSRYFDAGPIPGLGGTDVEVSGYEVRLVNSGDKHLCIRPTLLMDGFTTTIAQGYYYMKPTSTAYIGILKELPVRLEAGALMVDSKWAINTLDIVDYDVKCRI